MISDEFALGLALGIYTLVIILVIYDTYLAMKLKRVRFEVAQFMFRDDNIRSSITQRKGFQGVSMFMMPSSRDLYIREGDKRRLFDKKDKFLDVAGMVFMRIITIIASPIIFVAFMVNIIFVAVNILHNVVVRNAEAVYDLNRRKDQARDMYLNWFIDKQARIKKVTQEIKGYQYKEELQRAEKDNKTKIVKSIKTQGLHFDEHKGLI